ncbi:MAG: diphosphomevalonate decarboxylase [Coxiellaceae bacterium]|jgi:diphosphomevalonate decarboxylase|nr:diphosphomevalonate decarboxylase [Coxiellaceae bacterium]
MKKVEVVQHILGHIKHGSFINSCGGSAWAPSNVALCKYWGKRNLELNLPVTSSLSISLGHKGAHTKIKQGGSSDHYVINGSLIKQNTKFAIRLKNFLDLFRPKDTNYLVKVNTNVPIATGFASSACGFASLVLALNNLYTWRLSQKELSILARLGSGSACRSIFNGFVEWQKGERDDGMDNYGMQLEYVWPELRIGILMISVQEKPLSSRDAMERTVNTSPLYLSWPKQVAEDLTNLKLALINKNFMSFGKIAEDNAIVMHTTISEARPPINYSLPETLQAIVKVQELRNLGAPVFFTQDAGPNLQLLFLVRDEQKVLNIFPQLEIVSPFSIFGTKRIILVDDNDVAVGGSEKMDAHVYGQLHRAFSVVILRRRNDKIEALLQKRSLCKYHSANLWSNTCCSHPMHGENIVIAAENRLQEEMGFSVPLKEIGRFHYRAHFSDVNLIENEIDHILIGFSDVEKPLFNPYEAQDSCWMELDALKHDTQNHQDKYTVWLPQLIDFLLGKIHLI